MGAGGVAGQTGPGAERSADDGGSGGGPTADVRAVRLDEPGRMTVDGVMDESAWAGAGVVLLPYETFPGTNAPAPVQTRCRMLYDEEALYLGTAMTGWASPTPSSVAHR